MVRAVAGIVHKVPLVSYLDPGLHPESQRCFLTAGL